MEGTDGSHLVRVDEGLADGELDASGTLEVDADEGSGHRRVTGQEQGAALLQEADEPVADGVDRQIGSIVAHPYHDGGWLVT